MLKQFLERKGLSYLAKVRLADLKPAPFLLINYKFAEIVFRDKKELLPGAMMLSPPVNPIISLILEKVACSMRMKTGAIS